MLTTEAKYVIVANAAKHTIWIYHFLYAIYKYYTYGLKPTNILFTKPKPTQLGINNQGVLALASNPMDHQ
jgi:hypothetical protein